VNLVGIVSPICSLDGKPKRGYMALEHVKANLQFAILDTIQYLVERALEPL
jgi:hypothetical protein